MPCKRGVGFPGPSDKGRVAGATVRGTTLLPNGRGIGGLQIGASAHAEQKHPPLEKRPVSGGDQNMYFKV